MTTATKEKPCPTCGRSAAPKPMCRMCGRAMVHYPDDPAQWLLAAGWRRLDESFRPWHQPLVRLRLEPEIVKTGERIAEDGTFTPIYQRLEASRDDAFTERDAVMAELQERQAAAGKSIIIEDSNGTLCVDACAACTRWPDDWDSARVRRGLESTKARAERLRQEAEEAALEQAKAKEAK